MLRSLLSHNQILNSLNLKFSLLALFYSVALLGCSSYEKNEGIHPDPTHFPPDSLVDFSIDISNTQKVTKPLPHFFKSGNLETIASIGDDSVLANEYHKVPKQLDVDPNGNIYIAQNRVKRIRVYNKDGRFAYNIGRDGRGPGEFLEIISFTFDKRYETLYVLDVHQLEIFEKTDDRFEYKTSVPHKFLGLPTDMCRINEALYISGRKITEKGRKAFEDGSVRGVQASNKPPITKIDLKSFKHLKSFGYEYKSYVGWGGPDARLSETMLSCNERTDTVVGIMKYFPYIFGYDSNGQQKWVSKLNGYLSTKFREEKTSEGPAFYHFVNEEMHHWKYPTQRINNKEYSLLQFGHTPRIEYLQNTKKSSQQEPRTILINTETGKLFLSDAYPYIGAWKKNVAITMDINPENFINTFNVNKLTL